MLGIPDHYKPLQIVIATRWGKEPLLLASRLQALAGHYSDVEISQNSVADPLVIRSGGIDQLERFVAAALSEIAADLWATGLQVVYAEALSESVELEHTHSISVGATTQYARLRLRFEPRSEAECIFVNEAAEDAVPAEYLPAIERAFRLKMQSGPTLGCQIIGVKATLLDGDHHPVHSSPLAFEIATRAILRSLEPWVLIVEPIMDVEITTPEDCIGSVVGDLNSRRGTFRIAPRDENTSLVTGRAPLGNLLDYSRGLRDLSGGLASFSMKLAGLDFVPGRSDTDPDVPAAAALRA